MGYAAACLGPDLRKALAGKPLAAPVVEVVYLVFAVVVVVVLNDVMLRAGFTLIATLAVLLISLGLGPVSKLLSVSPLVRLGRFELDFYVFHQPCILLAGLLVAGHGRVALLGLALTVVSVALWRALKPVAIKRISSMLIKLGK